MQKAIKSCTESKQELSSWYSNKLLTITHVFNITVVHCQKL